MDAFWQIVIGLMNRWSEKITLGELKMNWMNYEKFVIENGQSMQDIYM
jgi:hypothetical protein